MDPLKFDLHRLRLLREFREHGTIAAVAAALQYSSASISQQLALLQREVGTVLVEPEGRGLRLTPQAHVLLQHVDVIFAQLEQAETDLAIAQVDVAGTVRLAAFQSALLTVVPTALEALRRRHPRLRVEVVEAESELARSQLLPRHFDLVLDEVFPGQEFGLPERLRQDDLCVDVMRVADAQASAPRGTLSAYEDRPWVMEPAGSPARTWAVAQCRAAGFEPDVQFESPDLVVHEGLAAAGLAVAFLPDLLPRLRGGQRHQLSTSHARRIVATSRSRSADHPAIAALRDALRTAAQDTNSEPYGHSS